MDLTDNHPEAKRKGILALQLHAGSPMTVEFKDIELRHLKGKEEFVTGAPLPITDAIIHPDDGAMYFTIGGRKVQSRLYRVTYVGNESTELVDVERMTTDALELRRSLEEFHGRQDRSAVNAAWPHLASDDRFVRWAARTAIEHQPVEAWADRALTESDPKIQVEALLGLARVTGICPLHRSSSSPPVDTQMRNKMLAAVLAIDLPELDAVSQLTLQRTLQIILTRFGRPDDATIQKLTAALDPLFPAKSFELNWLLCETLAWLQSPTVAAKAIALSDAAPTQEEHLKAAMWES